MDNNDQATPPPAPSRLYTALFYTLCALFAVTCLFWLSVFSSPGGGSGGTFASLGMAMVAVAGSIVTGTLGLIVTLMAIPRRWTAPFVMTLLSFAPIVWMIVWAIARS